MSKEKLISNVRESLKRLSELELIANELDSRWQEDPENEELENAFDQAYEKEYRLHDEVCKMVVELIGVDYKVAKQMIMTKRNDIENLLSKTA